MKIVKQLIYISFLLFTSLVSAQRQVKHALYFKHLGIGNGLPQSTVNCIAQDSTGFIWFGTMGGLSRYDGNSFKTFSHNVNTSGSMPSNNVTTLLVLTNNKILVGTANGAVLYEPKYEKVEMVANSNGIEINKIKTGPSGQIWFATSVGLLVYNRQFNALQSLEWLSSDVQSSEIFDVEEDDEGLLWIGNRKSRLACYDVKRKKAIELPDALKKQVVNRTSLIYRIKKDLKGNLYFGTITNGVIVYQNNSKHTAVLGDENKGKAAIRMVRDIQFSNNGDWVWIAGRNGLFQYDIRSGTMQSFISDRNDPYSLSNNSICALLEDRSGVLWVGTYLGGVNFVQKKDMDFLYLNRAMPNGGLSNPIIYSSVFDSTRNVLWLGTGGGGLNRYDLKSKTIKHFSLRFYRANASIESDFVEALAILPSQKLLVGTLRGLFEFDPEREKDVLLPIDTSKQRAVFSLFNDAYGTWIGTSNKVFYRSYAGKMLAFYWDKDHAINGELSSLRKDRKGGVWVGQSKGLLYWQPNTDVVISYDSVALLKRQRINSILEDNAGNVWFGTDENGVIIYEPKQNKFTSLSKISSYNSTQARGLLKDYNGNIWISGINELWKISLTENGSLSDIQLHANKMEAGNGLRSNEFSKAVSLLPDSSLFFGGYDGGVLFNDKNLSQNQFRTPIVVTDFRVENMPDAESRIFNGLAPGYLDSVKIPYKYSYFSIYFSALNFINYNQNKYAYKMDGLASDDWHYVGNGQQATYTDLSPGDYTFIVKCANNDGLWNDDVHKIHITIIPPIWRTWYAYSLYVISLSLIVWIVVRTNKKAVRLKNKLELQRRHNEMNKEFAERKVNFYTNISHEIKTPLSLIVGPLDKLSLLLQKTTSNQDKVHTYFAIMKRNSEKLLTLVAQLLDYRRIETGNLKLQLEEVDIVGFVHKMYENFVFVAQEKSIDYKYTSTIDYLIYSFDPEKMEQVFNNLLSNAFKFTQEEGRVHLFLDVEKDPMRDDSVLVIKISDNGRGIEKENIAYLFEPFHYYDRHTAHGAGIGLTYARSLVELHNGVIKVDSVSQSDNPDSYTIFTLELVLKA